MAGLNAKFLRSRRSYCSIRAPEVQPDCRLKGQVADAIFDRGKGGKEVPDKIRLTSYTTKGG